MALFAHVSRFGVLVEGVFGDFCAHLQLVQLVSSVGQVATEARHFSTRKRIPSSGYRMAGVWVSEAIIGAEFNRGQIARDAFRPALQMAIETDIVHFGPQESWIARSMWIVTAGAHA